jgi:hypothetical protein
LRIQKEQVEDLKSTKFKKPYIVKYLISVYCILTVFSCEKVTLNKEEITQIRTICIETLIKEYTLAEIIEDGRTYVIDTYLSDSVNLSIWKDRFFAAKWLDTISEFKRTEFVELINKERIVTFSKNEMQINENSNLVKLNITNISRHNYYSNDTLGSLRLRPLIFDSNKNISIQILHFHRGYDEGVTLAIYLRKIKGKWSVQGRKILSIS